MAHSSGASCCSSSDTGISLCDASGIGAFGECEERAGVGSASCSEFVDAASHTKSIDATSHTKSINTASHTESINTASTPNQRPSSRPQQPLRTQYGHLSTTAPPFVQREPAHPPLSFADLRTDLTCLLTTLIDLPTSAPKSKVNAYEMCKVLLELCTVRPFSSLDA